MRIGIAGCTGRMGQMLVKAVAEHEHAVLAAVSALTDHVEQAKAWLTREGIEHVMVTDSPERLAEACDAVIDFTAPEHSLALAKHCAALGTVMVCGTTGLSAKQQGELQALADDALTLVQSANFSLGVNLLLSLTEQTARLLDERYDIEISETHHRYKKDAPSGTALALGQAAAKGRDVILEEASDRARDGITGERGTGTIGFHALRGGDVIGDHTVMFAALGERIELTHKASDRRIYADGALHAALWAKDQAHGLYSMQDVLK